MLLEASSKHAQDDVKERSSWRVVCVQTKAHALKSAVATTFFFK
jgi:hypothetical protein